MNDKLFLVINGWSGHFVWLDHIMIFTSQYGLWLYAAWLAILWCYGNNSAKRSVLYAGMAGIGALLMNVVIGHVYFEQRPFVNHSVHLLYPHAPDASFPSDHTTGAFSLATLMMLRRNHGAGRWGYGMLVLAILIGLSRVYVGHHYPGDVLGSIAVALVVSLLIHKGDKYFAPFVNLILKLYDKMLMRLWRGKKGPVGLNK